MASLSDDTLRKVLIHYLFHILKLKTVTWMLDSHANPTNGGTISEGSQCIFATKLFQRSRTQNIAIDYRRD